MATTTTNAHAPMGAIAILHFVDAAYGAAQKFTAWKDARKTRKILALLSDAQLEDTGLTRNGRA